MTTPIYSRKKPILNIYRESRSKSYFTQTFRQDYSYVKWEPLFVLWESSNPKQHLQTCSVGHYPHPLPSSPLSALPSDYLQEAGLVYDTDPCITPANGHVCCQNRPSVCLRIVHLHTCKVAGTIITTNHIDHTTVAYHTCVPPAVVHLCRGAPPGHQGGQGQLHHPDLSESYLFVSGL